MTPAHYSTTPAQVRGIGMVEIMIGLAVALMASLVIFQTLAVSEGYRRTTVSSAHANDNGNFALFSLERQLAGAGAGLVRAAGLWGCPLALRRGSAPVLPAPSAFPTPFDSLPQTVRVAPLLVLDGGGSAPDTLLVLASKSAFAGTSVKVDAAPNANEVAVTSAAGINPGDLLMAFDAARPGSDCTVVQTANSLVPPVAPATVAMIANPLRYGGAVYSPVTGLTGYSTSTVLMNLGAAPTLVAFAVGTDAASGRPFSLLRHDLIVGGVPVAIADNIVNMQVLYGVAATSSTDTVSEWVSATGAWALAALTDGSATASDRIGRLRGVRIALIARSATEERDAASPAAWALFLDRPAETVTGTLDADAQRFRYRSFDTIVPLRNMLLAND